MACATSFPFAFFHDQRTVPSDSRLTVNSPSGQNQAVPQEPVGYLNRPARSSSCLVLPTCSRVPRWKITHCRPFLQLSIIAGVVSRGRGVGRFLAPNGLGSIAPNRKPRSRLCCRQGIDFRARPGITLTSYNFKLLLVNTYYILMPKALPGFSILPSVL